MEAPIPQTISVLQARRLALARAGLLKPEWTRFPLRAGRSQRRACYSVIARFGYLQLDTIPIAGARSHALVLMSRLPDLDPELPESLLRPKARVFEYWGHEASWIRARALSRVRVQAPRVPTSDSVVGSRFKGEPRGSERDAEADPRRRARAHGRLRGQVGPQRLGIVVVETGASKLVVGRGARGARAEEFSALVRSDGAGHSRISAEGRDERARTPSRSFCSKRSRDTGGHRLALWSPRGGSRTANH